MNKTNMDTTDKKIHNVLFAAPHRLFSSKIVRVAFFIGFFAAIFCQKAEAQRVALNTDVLEWAASTPNISIETRLSRRITLDIGISANPFRNYFGMDKYRFANLRFQPEVRYWFNRPMACHYIGINATAGFYDLILDDKHYKGDLISAGLRYGYALVLSRHWNVVFSGGLSAGYIHGYSFTTAEGHPAEPNQSKIIPLPDVSVTFTYILK